MKVTVDAAMRARDVSRPRADHEETAQAGEPEPGRPCPAPAKPALAAERAGPPAPAATAGSAGDTPKARRPHRRRRRR